MSLCCSHKTNHLHVSECVTVSKEVYASSDEDEGFVVVRVNRRLVEEFECLEESYQRTLPIAAPNERVPGRLYHCERCSAVLCGSHCPRFFSNGMCIKCWANNEHGDKRVVLRNSNPEYVYAGSWTRPQVYKAWKARQDLRTGKAPKKARSGDAPVAAGGDQNKVPARGDAVRPVSA